MFLLLLPGTEKAISMHVTLKCSSTYMYLLFYDCIFNSQNIQNGGAHDCEFESSNLSYFLI